MAKQLGRFVGRAVVALVVGVGLVGAGLHAARAVPAEQGVPIYSDATLWNPLAEPFTAAMNRRCGVAMLIDIRPEEHATHMGCIVAAMRDTGASPEAIRFFEATRYFLVRFEEAGRIDIGLAASPWLDMGRGEMVFLNGSPSAILLSFAFDFSDSAWESLPAYAEVKRRAPNAFPWPVNATAQANEALADDRQRITMAIPLRDCRACPNVASMPIAFTFDAAGVLLTRDILPPILP